jgi:signal transduction histidine kinase
MKQDNERMDLPVKAELRERLKELRFFHHAARLLNMPGEPRDVVRALVELLPSAWRYPDLAEARVCFQDAEIATQPRGASDVALRADFELDAERRGFVEVWYPEPPEPSGGGAFLAEERALLDSCAELLKAYVERATAKITSRRVLQAEAAEQTAVSDNRAKDEFLGMVSHELRSSLHVMLGWVQMLRQPNVDDETTARGLSILERNVTLQSKLIEDLLDLSRVLSGKLALERRAVDLKELLGFAIDAKRPAAQQKQLRLTSELRDVGLVWGDPQRLQQVVYNLLANAVKFTPAGGAIHVTLDESLGRARIRVADSGVGISPELLPHVFERFRQAEVHGRGRSAGLGLGLPIARDLVTMHGGSIEAISDPEARGTTFEVLLPLAPG